MRYISHLIFNAQSTAVDVITSGLLCREKCRPPGIIIIVCYKKPHPKTPAQKKTLVEVSVLMVTCVTPDGQQKDSSRRQSLEPEITVMKVSTDKLEAMEQQRRASMQQRRTSLAEVISDWPTLQKRIVQKEV